MTSHERPPRTASFVRADDDPIAARSWLLSVTLLRIHWAAVPLCVLLFVYFPPKSNALVLALVLILGLTLGNAGLAWLLQTDAVPLPRRIILVERLAIALEWGVALGLIGAYARNARSHAPAVLLILVLLAGLAEGLSGLFIAALAAAGTTLGMVAVQFYVLDVLEASTARDVIAGWMVFIVLAALVGGGMAWMIGEYGRMQLHWLSQASAGDRATYGLSPRELMLLPWLAHAELTYKEIGTELYISPRTVKSHVQHIGQKLGIPGDRWVVVEAARERGLLPSTPESSTPQRGGDRPD